MTGKLGEDLRKLKAMMDNEEIDQMLLSASNRTKKELMHKKNMKSKSDESSHSDDLRRSPSSIHRIRRKSFTANKSPFEHEI